MNQWVKKSIALANSHGYLDRLSEIYPVALSFEERLTAEEERVVRMAFQKGNKKNLISALLNLERFPLDDPYVGFLKHDRRAIERNPKTIHRIGKRLFDMGLENLLAGANRVKSPSRQFGQSFRRWAAKKLGYPVLTPQKFLDCDEIAVLDGADAALKRFAKEHLGYRDQKGLDLVARVRGTFVIGETKFVSTSGGTQDKSFRETIVFVKKKQGNKVHRIAVLDGVVWIAGTRKKKLKSQNLYESVSGLKNGQVALSSLLLKSYLESLKNK
ncbi:MAG: hypothetical protein AAB967_02735 [Patescibacteria group bacterium]